MPSLRRTLTALSLTVFVSGLPLLASPGAIVTPTAGTVAVNGQPVAAGSAVVSGDQVTTSASGTARLVLPGASLVAASQTRFRMESTHGALQIRLTRGLLEVAGSVPVLVAAHTVLPATAQARFDVYDLAGEAYVTAVAGSVTVKSASRAVAVPAGTTVKFREQQALPAPVALKTGISPLAVTGMVVAAAAAAGTAVYFAERNKNKNNSVSPSSL